MDYFFLLGRHLAQVSRLQLLELLGRNLFCQIEREQVQRQHFVALGAQLDRGRDDLLRREERSEGEAALLFAGKGGFMVRVLPLGEG